MRTSGALWKCEKCGRPFANRNQTHSCGRFTVGEFLEGKSLNAVDLYRAFAAAIDQLGGVVTAPAKTRVGFQVRMIFASVNRLNDDGLVAHVVFARRLEHPRFTKVESISPRNHVHHFVINDVSQIDEEVKAWLLEAHAVGKQDHLK
ncbi:MAG TPA: DUF5655 domain-containing protein [Pyrinomonadaceae bacterium]|nr:DUF5655 domain-containing protein [Pyrinomonadaceae bacterium]